MNEVLQFLKENPIFYLATIDGDTPRVRPFGFCMEYKGKLCFCTSNNKDVYRQMKANPNIEISVASKNDKWLRLKGKAVFISNHDSKMAAFEASPSLARLYSEDDPLFEIFYIDECEASFYYSFKKSRPVKL